MRGRHLDHRQGVRLMRLMLNSHTCGSEMAIYQAASHVIRGLACRSGLVLVGVCRQERPSDPVCARRSAGAGVLPGAVGGDTGLSPCRPSKDRQLGGERAGAGS